MKKRYAVPALAGLLTLGAAGVVEASPPSTSPAQASSSDDDGDSKVGLWGLLGLAGLAGLAGLKRRNDPYDRARYDNDRGATSSTRTP
jgi:MYXO-CTERM domain-containing protein